LPPATRTDPHNAKGKAKGISNSQAKELARLQRVAGETYSGSGITEDQARAEIQRLRRLLDEP
jgi:hypothetical protein